MARVTIAVAPCPSEVSIGNIAWKQLMVCLCELGLQPTSSARCHALPIAKKKDTGGGNLPPTCIGRPLPASRIESLLYGKLRDCPYGIPQNKFEMSMGNRQPA
jgi:hypothetical protein